MDKYLFRKDVAQDSLPYIDASADTYIALSSFDKYIVVINKSSVDGYTASSKKSFSLNIAVNNPIMNSNGRFFIIGELNGQTAYLISNENITWQKSFDGQITSIYVNKNGYSTIVLSQTSYKSVIIMVDPSGKEVFTTYLANTVALNTCISNDNKYLAIAEVDTDGASAKSSVKIVSVEKAKSDPTNSVVNTFSADPGNIIVQIEYNDKNKVACLYSDNISIVNGDQNNVVYTTNSNTSFLDVRLNNNILAAEDVSSGIFSSYTKLKIINMDNKETDYNSESIAKSIYTNNDTIAMNFGTEVRFLNTSGWLIKKYSSKQEVQNILLFNNAAGIVYRNKIEIVSL